VFDNWWKAHELDFWISGIAIAALIAGAGIWALCVWIGSILRARRDRGER
jgi:hypothetical protein